MNLWNGKSDKKWTRPRLEITQWQEPLRWKLIITLFSWRPPWWRACSHWRTWWCWTGSWTPRCPWASPGRASPSASSRSRTPCCSASRPRHCQTEWIPEDLIYIIKVTSTHLHSLSYHVHEVIGELHVRHGFGHVFHGWPLDRSPGNGIELERCINLIDGVQNLKLCTYLKHYKWNHVLTIYLVKVEIII